MTPIFSFLKNIYFLMALTVSVSILLSILPIPAWAIPFWPAWPLLVLVYWCLALPDQYGIKFAWCVGLLLDIIKNTLIGQHALTYMLTIYMVGHFYPLLRNNSLTGQIIHIGILLLPYFFLTFWIEGMLYPKIIIWQQWTPLLSSMLLWPWIFSMLRMVRHQTK